MKNTRGSPSYRGGVDKKSSFFGPFPNSAASGIPSSDPPAEKLGAFLEPATRAFLPEPVKPCLLGQIGAVPRSLRREYLWKTMGREAREAVPLRGTALKFE